MRSVVALLLLAFSALVVAQTPSGSKGHLVVAMDQNQRLFVRTTLDREAVNRLRLGNDPAGIDSFTTVNDQRLVELAASVLRLDPEAVITIWGNPNTASKTFVDRVVELLHRASARIGQTQDRARLFILPVPFPPFLAVPQRLGASL